MSSEIKKDSKCRSWFCVFNNPAEHGIEGTPAEIVEKVIEIWIEDNPQRTCAVAYCISKEGLHHLHAVLEDDNENRFSALKKLYPGMHIEPTKGNKRQAEDYIKKEGKYSDTSEEIVYLGRHGEIKGAQGQRRDLGVVEKLLEQGKTPNEIFDMNISYRRYEKMIKDAYFRKRWKETPAIRKITVYWHLGKSGTGKSYEMIKLMQEKGSEGVYLITDYDNGFDKYGGEKVLFMDEFRGQIKYTQLLTILDVYRAQIRCRYTNVYALWEEVHITSVMHPEEIYKKMVTENRKVDTIEQLIRRIDYVVLHKKQNEEYEKIEIPIEIYKNNNKIISEYIEDSKWYIEAEIQMIKERSMRT